MWQIVFFVIKILFKIWVWKILEVFLPQSQDVFISFCYLVVCIGEFEYVVWEEFIHTACDKTIPNYRKSTTRKPTEKSIWNNNIAEATKNGFVAWGQTINCDNFLFNPIAVLFAIK
jgi:hypothetical protein